MPKPRRTTDPEDPSAPPVDPSAPPVDPAGDAAGVATGAGDEFDPIADALSQLGSDNGAYILIHKAETHQSKSGWAYCARYDLGAFNIDDVRDRHGAGSYRAVFCRSNGKCFRQIQFLIAAPAVTAAPVASLGPVQGHHAVGAAPPSILEQLVISSIEGTNKMLVALVSALAGGGGGVKGADLIAAFREGREGGGGSKSGLSEAIEAMRFGAELSGGGSPAGEADPLLSVAGPLMGLLEKMLNRPAVNPPAASTALPGRTQPTPAAGSLPGRTAPASSAPPAPHSTLVPPPVNDAEPFLRLARAWLPQMLKEAVSGREGYTWGLFMAQRVKPAFKPHLEMLAAAEPADRLQLLISLEPAFADHAEWVEDVAEGILDALHPEDDTDEEPDADPATNLPDGAAIGGGRSDGDGAHDAAAHPLASGLADREGTRGAN